MPKKLSGMDFLAASKERPEQFESGLNFLNKVNDGVSAAQRGAVSAAQTATSPMDVLEGAKAAFLNPEQAATWQDIAKKAGLENKYGLAAAGALGTIAEADLIPGPNFGAAKKEAKLLGESLQNLNKEGKLLIKGTKEAPKLLGEVAPTLKNLNKEGKLVVRDGIDTAGQKLRQAAKAEQELVQAQMASKNPALQLVPQANADMAALKVRNEAKEFAKQAVKDELRKQPALARDPEYLKSRIQSLFNFYTAQKK